MQFGQWDTTSFEKEDQTLKLLKVMSLSPSFSSPPSMTSRANMALDQKSSDTLQQTLQQDYDQSMIWKYNHGDSPLRPARSSVYIDCNTSRVNFVVLILKLHFLISFASIELA